SSGSAPAPSPPPTYAAAAPPAAAPVATPSAPASVPTSPRVDEVDARSPFDAPLDFGAVAPPLDPFGFDGSTPLSLALVDPRAPTPEVAPFSPSPAAPALPLAPTYDALPFGA